MLDYAFVIYVIVFLRLSTKGVAPSQIFGRGKCKLSRQIFGQKPPWNDLRRPHSNAIFLAKHLNRRSCCTALAASRRRRMRCKNFRQPRINSPCVQAAGRASTTHAVRGGGGVPYFIAASGQRRGSCGCNGTPEFKTITRASRLRGRARL